MSQDFMDAELFADFIIEAKEHLETIEPNLLELEKTPDNLGLLNEIFRPMHSLKGASGFLGLNKINQLAHKSENILDELRKGSMVVTAEIMDVILSSTDALRQIIDNLETTNSEGDVEIDHIKAQIDVIMAEASGQGTPVNKTTAANTPEIPKVAPPPPAEIVEKAVPAAHVAETPAPQSPLPAKNSALTPAVQRSGLSSKDWIANQAQKQSYALTAFGEGHLKDFIDESFEIIEMLNSGLLSLEDGPAGQDELVNDLFRYFHNLKGNSGIIGFQELNSLTHEAETLLNNIRRGEAIPTHELIDLLLFVADVMESLVQGIDPNSGSVSPFETSLVLAQLQQAVAGGPIQLPAGLMEASPEEPAPAESTPEEPVPENTAPQKTEQLSPLEVVTPVILPVGTDGDDLDIFSVTVRQQIEIIHAAMGTLKKDGNHKESIDALYRCLVAIKNACSFVHYEEIKVYAERTAGIVESARSSDMDFGMLLDMLGQEVEIINDMLLAQIAEAGTAVTETPPESAEIQAPAPAPVTEETAPTAPQISAPVAEQPQAEPVPPRPASPDTRLLTRLPQSPEGESEPSAPLIKTVPIATAKAPAQVAKAPVAKTPTPKAAPAAKTPAPPAAAAADHKGSSTIRVDHEKLDHLMNLIGELIINRNRYTLIARSLEEKGQEVDVAQVAQSLSETTYAMARISDDLQDTIMKVRMVPVASVFSRFPRLVRDLSRKSGKEVDLILEGEETELDKSVVEVIGDPLVHLIRNAMDHGVEAEAERIAKGKNPKGRVVLRAYHRGNSVAIEIEDDGKGIDPEKMREVAVRKGILNQDEARQLDDREAMELIFAPGFSSAETITDISGRGVGMDVVRTNIKNLKGSVSISSEVGKGTRFTLSLPLTLAIIDALMVNVAGQMYAIPLDAVSETTKIEAVRLTDVKGRKAVTLRGEVIGIVEMAELLCLPRKPLPEMLPVVVIHDNERRLGIVVDRLLERQEIVIKPLGAYLGDLNGISGATIMGDGSVILILDPHEIYMLATSKAS
ncbi:MAG: Hpt domain-containing protein [Desulfovibrionaceae bacterium]